MKTYKITFTDGTSVMFETESDKKNNVLFAALLCGVVTKLDTVASVALVL